MTFACGHKQKSDHLPWDLIRETAKGIRPNEFLPCVQCSKPNWDRIAERRESTTFDEVLAKMLAAGIGREMA